MNTEELIEKLSEEISESGDQKIEIDVDQLQRIMKTAKEHLDFHSKLAEHQLEPDSDLITIGELVLTELDMWM